MGLGGMIVSATSSAAATLTSNIAPNPNPYRFKVIETWHRKGLWLSVITYEGCTTFEGTKLLITSFDPKKRTRLDPHFNEGSGVLARFEPTDTGMQKAMMVLNGMKAPKA